MLKRPIGLNVIAPLFDAPLRTQVKPTRGLTCQDSGVASVRTPNALSTAGLFCGRVVNAFPSMRAPYIT